MTNRFDRSRVLTIGLAASSSSTASSPITLIDHYDSSFDPTNSADTLDGVHPTPAGASIMATVTLNAIAASGYF
jgi:lysophospholipase L1-like esterase